MLESVNWNQVFVQDDVNIAYNKFNVIMTNAFNESFPLKPLSRKRAEDKPWITTALKTSSRMRNSLYKNKCKPKIPQTGIDTKVIILYSKKLHWRLKICIVKNYLIQKHISLKNSGKISIWLHHLKPNKTTELRCLNYA